MIDALLYAVRDAIRSAGFNYSYADCEITEDEGHPPPRCGNVFISVHRGKSHEWTGYNDNNQASLYDFSVTVTMRLVRVSLDRVGDQLIARNIRRVPEANREGLHAKCDQISRFLHMNWKVVVLTNQSPASANDNLSAWSTGTVYGFCEPARYEGPAGDVQIVGDEWFGTEPSGEGDTDFGVKKELRFTGAKRFQPQTTPVGSFV